MKILPAYSEAYDHFGVSVAVYDEEFVVGADTADGVSDDTGAAYVFFPTFETDLDKQNRDKQNQQNNAESVNNQLSGATAAFAFMVVLAPVALGVVWWMFSVNKSPSRHGMMVLPQDSRHGTSVPWSMHGAFDESSWGLESSHSGNSSSHNSNSRPPAPKLQTRTGPLVR